MVSSNRILATSLPRDCESNRTTPLELVRRPSIDRLAPAFCSGIGFACDGGVSGARGQCSTGCGAPFCERHRNSNETLWIAMVTKSLSLVSRRHLASLAPEHIFG